MFYWPGKSAAGTRVNTPVVPEDFYPTILSMAGIQEYHTDQTLDGKNLCDLIVKGSQLARKAMDDGTITNQKQANAFVVPESVSGINPERPVIFHMPHRWRVEEQADVDFMSAIREGEWKLVYRMRTGALELYNLPTDISERNDVATAHPDIVKRLASDLGLQLRAWDAPMPIYRATGKPAPMPDKLK
jgi:arylsulfatase A-like enzyme